MKNKDIKALNVSEIQEKINSETDNLNRLKFGHAVSPIEDPSKIRKARKTIARLKTELRAKQLSK